MRKMFIFLAMLCSTVLYAQVSGQLTIPTVDHATIAVSRNGNPLLTGAVVTEGDVLEINYTAAENYRIVGESTKSVTLTADLFRSLGNYSINLSSQGWSSTVNHYGYAGWRISMPPYGSEGTKSGSVILEEEGETKVAFMWNVDQGYIEYGQFILTCYVNGVEVKRHDFTSTVNPYERMLLDTVTYTGDGKDTIEWRCQKTASGSWGDSGGRTFFVGNVSVLSEAYETKYDYLVPLPSLRRIYEVIFPTVAHASLAEATLNGAPFTGGEVFEDDYLYYKYVADDGWVFEDNGAQSFTNEFTLKPYQFDSQGRLTVYVSELQAPPLVLNYKFLDASSVEISWDGQGVYESYRLCVSAEEQTSDPAYWKGMQHLTDTVYVATGLVVGQKYYIYLEGSLGSVTSDWITETFVMQEPGDPCLLTIEMKDADGDGWNGNGIYFVEDGEETYITLEYGAKGTATYASFGDSAQIVWEKGSWASEVSFVVRSGDGHTIYRMEEGEGSGISSGTILYNDVLCKPLCSLSNLVGTASGTNFSVTWDAEGADSYEVAVLQIADPTDAQLDSAKVSVTTKSYSFTGVRYHGYHVFVRPVNAKVAPQKWQHVFVFEGISPEIEAIRSYAQEINLSHIQSGHMMADALIGAMGTDIWAVMAYSITLAEETEIYCDLLSDDIDNYYFSIFAPTGSGGALVDVDGSNDKLSATLPAGKYYVSFSTMQDGAYTLVLGKSPTPRVIESLDFSDSGDFTDADILSHPYMGAMYAKCYSYTPKDTVNVKTTANAMSMATGLAIYINEIAPATSRELFFDGAYYPWSGTLLKDSTYYFIMIGPIEYDAEPTDAYSLSIIDMNKPITPLVPVAIGLNETKTGTFAGAAYWEFPFTGDIVPTKAYSIRLTDTTRVQVKFDSPDYTSTMMGPSMYGIVFLDSIGGYIVSSMSPNMPDPSVLTFLPDTTYYVVISDLPAYGGKVTDSYSLTIYKEGHVPAPEPPSAIKAITLDYTETADFTDAGEWVFPYTGGKVFTKAFSITPTDTIEMSMLFNSPDYTTSMMNPSMYYFVFEGAIKGTGMRSSTPSDYTMTMTLLKDTTYYVILCCLPPYGGKATDRYTLTLRNMSAPTKTIMLESDTIIVDALTEADYIREWDTMGKVYEFVLTKDRTIGFSIEYLGNDPAEADNLSLKLYPSLDDSSIDNVDGSDDYYEYYDLSGYAEGAHYYFVVRNYNDNPTDYRMTFRVAPDYNNLPIKDSIAVNAGYRSALSMKDGFTKHEADCSYDHNGSYEAYKVHLERDTMYRLMMYVPKQDVPNYYGHSITVFNPESPDYTYSTSVIRNNCEEDDYNEGWVVLSFTPDWTDDYVIMFDDYAYSKFLKDSVVYEFSVEQVMSFSDLVAYCPAVKEGDLPIRESGVFADNKKVMPDWMYEFHDDDNTYIEYYGAYDALARAIRVGAGDTLFVEFGGDIDATIQIYDGNTLALLKTIDDIPYNFPYESGFIVNELTDSADYVVVCSFNKVVLADAAWSLRMSKSEKDLEPILVTPQADKEYIEIYESEGVTEALEALSQIKFTAVDAANAVVCTLSNDRFAWQVDIEGGSARYEFNDMDLPAGYKFVEPSMFITVEIDIVPDPHTGFINTEFGEEGKTIKFIQNGQVFIQRDGMIFNILGQRVK